MDAFRRRYSDLRPTRPAGYEAVSYRYKGLRSARAAIAAGVPLFFAAWHHGAVAHLDYGILRVLPETAVFTWRKLQYGRFSSIPIRGDAPFSVFRMYRLLSDGRPVLCYVDGLPLGNTVAHTILGLPAKLPIAPVRALRSLPGARIVPVAACLRDGNVVEIRFHPPTPRLKDMTDRDILDSTLSCLEKDLRERGPEQAGLDFLINREYLATVGRERLRIGSP